MDYKDISERIALLTQEIREVQRINSAYPNQSDGNPLNRTPYEQRELRLRMMLKPTQREQ